jgi:acetyl-CoA C-acetyltransferase
MCSTPLKARNGFDGHAVEDVIWGNVTQVGEQGGCLARTAVLASELDERIPASPSTASARAVWRR